MKIREICDKIKSGKIDVDLAGHSLNFDKNKLIEIYDLTVAKENGLFDGKWENSSDEQMRKFFTSQLDLELHGDRFYLNAINDKYHIQCDNCGNLLHFSLQGNRLILNQFYNEKTNKIEKQLSETCEYSQTSPFCGNISVKGKLIFANYFLKNKFEKYSDYPENDNRYLYWSLNSIAGQRRVAKFKLEQYNIAVGQMTNTSVGIYLSLDKKSVIVGPDIHPAEYLDYENDSDYYKAINEPIFPNYCKMGNISLDVWRYEASDTNSIGNNIDLIENYVEVDVVNGNWRFQHNFTSLDDEEKIGYVYSKFDLIEV
jgi:hypothetical protein